MSRMIKLLAPLGLTAAILGATFAACGARPGSPSEMPPVAPRPTPADPSGAPGSPGGMPNPTEHGTDAGGAAPGPISVRTLPTPTVAAEAYGNASSNQPPQRDAGTGDSYAPPLPPIPDSAVLVDSRVEPRDETKAPSWPPADPQWPSFPP